MSKAAVTLIWPGIAPILKQEINKSILPPNLKRLLKTARFTADETRFQRLLVNQFSDEDITALDLPLASLFGENLLFADPCHLLADRDRLILFSEDLDISKDEKLALMAEIQPLLTEFKANFIENDNSEHWLLQLEEKPNLTLTALEDVSTMGLEEALPQSAERHDWLRLWNEIQMQLFNAEVNQQRIAQGKLAINSVWFWGMGQLSLDHDRWSEVVGTNPLLSLLAQSSNADLKAEIDYSNLLENRNYLCLLDEVDLESDWLAQLNIQDETIVKPLLKQCKQAKISQLTLHIPDYGYFKLKTLDCWRFWRY